VRSLEVRLILLPCHDARVEQIWGELEAKTAPTYFLTWGWVLTWLSCLPPEQAPFLAAIQEDGRTVGAFFVARRRVVRHGLLVSNLRLLNATGVERFDELCVEHNCILCTPGTALSLAALLALLPPDWDELLLPALSTDLFPGSALAEPVPGHRVSIDREVAAPYVDLARVRAAPDGYLSLLRPGTRAQVKRARRGFGALTLELAEDVAQAMDVYQELVRLHLARWRARGQPGAFADPWFDGFHRRLIASRFQHAEIQLLRVRAGETTVGCLYNLVASGRVLFYQGGLAEFGDPRLKPGLVCHAAAVEHNAARGHATYDLLGGEARYKRSLATDEARLVWARVQRPLLRFTVERWARRLSRALALRGPRGREAVHPGPAPAGVLRGAAAPADGAEEAPLPPASATLGECANASGRRAAAR
jgi:hypothetical protein